MFSKSFLEWISPVKILWLRQNRKLSLLLLTMLLCCGNLGCMTLGPKVETRYVILKPGIPFQILGNMKVKGKALEDGGQVVEQDIGGWITMPPEHFEALKRSIQK